MRTNEEIQFRQQMIEEGDFTSEDIKRFADALNKILA